MLIKASYSSSESDTLHSHVQSVSGDGKGVLRVLSENLLRDKELINDWITKTDILALTPKKCPKCESSKVLKIVYDEPGIDISTRPDLYFHGCDVIGEPFEWICMKCHWEWGKREDGQYNEDLDDDENV